MASRALPAWRQSLRRWAYSKSYFNQLGLMRDDVLHEVPVVTAAIDRLPKDILAARTFRISRAFLLSSSKQVLPKEEWMTLEQDEHYLVPYIEQIKKEMNEKADWNKK